MVLFLAWGAVLTPLGFRENGSLKQRRIKSPERNQFPVVSITISTSFAIFSRVKSPELEMYGSTSGA